MAGSMRERGRNKWYFEVSCGTDYTGKPLRYYKTFEGTKREAQKALNAFYVECSEGRVNKSGTMTFSVLADNYYNEATQHLKKSSKVSTNTIINKHLKPAFSKRKINKITRLDIQKYINAIDLSPKTVRNIYSVLTEIFKFAIDMEMITNTPCQNIKLPKLTKKEGKFYTEDEINKLLMALDPYVDGKEFTYKIAILLALFGGLRIGEVCGLDWENIDFNTNTIEIVKTRMVNIGGGMYEETPKTEKSQRTVALPVEIVEMLKELKKQQCKTDYLIQSPAVLRGQKGDPVYALLITEWYKRLCESIGVEFKGMHALRHTHASMLSGMNIDAAQISSRLGHSQISTTLNIYTHLFKNKDTEIAEKLSIQFEKLT